MWQWTPNESCIVCSDCVLPREYRHPDRLESQTTATGSTNTTRSGCCLRSEKLRFQLDYVAGTSSAASVHVWKQANAAGKVSVTWMIELADLGVVGINMRTKFVLQSLKQHDISDTIISSFGRRFCGWSPDFIRARTVCELFQNNRERPWRQRRPDCMKMGIPSKKSAD